MTDSADLIYPTQQLERHYLSGTFKDLPDEEMNKLKAGIEKYGQMVPGTLFEGKVLDGWQRYTACYELGIEWDFKELPDGVDPVEFVENINNNRRHESASIRAQGIVQRSTWRNEGRPKLEPEPAETEPVSAESAESAESPQAEPIEQETGPNEPVSEPPPPPPAPAPRSNKELAEAAGVGVSTIKRAKKAEKAGLGDKVLSGEMSGGEAAALADQIAAGDDSEQAPPKPKKPDRLTLAEGKALQEENDSLKKRLAALKTAHDALTTEFEALGASNDPVLMAETNARLAQFQMVCDRRDELMNENADLVREVRRLRKQQGLPS